MNDSAIYISRVRTMTWGKYTGNTKYLKLLKHIKFLWLRREAGTDNKKGTTNLNYIGMTIARVRGVESFLRETLKFQLEKKSNFF